MTKESQPKREVGSLRKHLLKGVAIASLIPAAVVAARGGESDLFGIDGTELNAEEKTFVTFLISTEILAVSTFSYYRLGDGAKIPYEESVWKYGVPASNFVFASMLLAEIYG